MVSGSCHRRGCSRRAGSPGWSAGSGGLQGAGRQRRGVLLEAREQWS